MGSISPPVSVVRCWRCRWQIRCAASPCPCMDRMLSGTDLDAYERAMLSRLAADAAAMYAELENGELRGDIARLERKLGAGKPATKAP